MASSRGLVDAIRSSTGFIADGSRQEDTAALWPAIDPSHGSRPPNGELAPTPITCNLEGARILLGWVASESTLYLSAPSPLPAPIDGSEVPAGALAVRSSGSTRSSKTIVHARERLLSNAAATARRLGLEAADRVLIPVPLHHMYGIGAALLPALIAGASIRLVPDADLLRIAAAERSFQPTVAFLVPAMVAALAPKAPRTSALRLTVVAGDRMTPRDAARYEHGRGPVIGLYGSSELGVIAVGNPSASAQTRHAAVGTPLPHVDVRIVEGRLQVRHPDGFVAWREADDPPPMWRTPPEWVDTGDLGALEDDRVRVDGRADHSVNRDGVLVPLRDVELAVEAVPGVCLAVVVAGAQTARGPRLTLFYEGSPAQEEAVRQVCSDLSRPARPDRIERRDALPTLPSGKPDRRTLAARNPTREDV